MLALVDCDPEKRVRAEKKGLEVLPVTTFTLLKNEPSGIFGAVSSGDRIQVYNTNLCLQKEGARDIFLRQCDSSVKEQLMFNFRSEGQEMEIYPFAETFLRGVTFEPEKCLTNHHHPREGERIYAEFCRRARNADHSMWVTY